MLKGRKADCHPEQAHVARGMCKNCYNTYRRHLDLAGARRKARNVRLRKLYNLSREDYDLMYLQQQCRCASCQDIMKEPHVDHNHTTGKVRALLCGNCNTALGLLKEDAGRLRCLLDYMTQYGTVHRA